MRSSRHTVFAVAGVVAVVIVAWTGGSAASAFRAAPVQLPGGAMPAAPTAAALNGSHEQLLNAYANLPVAFVENRGQIDERVRYYAQGPRYAFYLTRDELVLSFMNAEPAKSAVAISLQFLGGNPLGLCWERNAHRARSITSAGTIRRAGTERSPATDRSCIASSGREWT